MRGRHVEGVWPRGEPGGRCDSWHGHRPSETRPLPLPLHWGEASRFWLREHPWRTASVAGHAPPAVLVPDRAFQAPSPPSWFSGNLSEDGARAPHSVSKWSH